MPFDPITPIPGLPTKPDAEADLWNTRYLQIDALFNILENVTGTTFWNGVDFSTPAGTSDGHVINDEGTPLAQQVNLDFIGASVAAADNGGNTEVTINGAVLAKNIESITGNKTLTDASEPIQALTPDADWDVNLPAEAVTNPFFLITNVAGSGFTLTVKNDSPATVTTVADGETKLIVPDGVTWYILAGGGGASAFTGLTDTPGSYSGEALKLARVNAGETAIEFVADDSLTEIVQDTTPQLGGQLDVNGNAIGDGTLEILEFGETGSAINHLKVTNAAIGNAPKLESTGDDTDVDIDIDTKGAGEINANAKLNVTSGGADIVGTLTADDVSIDGDLSIANGQASFGKQTLTPGATVDWNLDSGPFAQLTLGQDTTINAPTNIEIGATYILKVINGASWTIAFNAIFKFPGGTAPTQTTGAAKYDIYTFVSFDGTNLDAVQVQDFS